LLQDKIYKLEDRIDKSIKKIKILQERYFRNCVAGSNNDFIDLLEILRGKEEPKEKYKLPFDQEVQDGLNSLNIRNDKM
jgi:hypothetical protein